MNSYVENISGSDVYLIATGDQINVASKKKLTIQLYLVLYQVIINAFLGD
jgi:hypothetical protein